MDNVTLQDEIARVATIVDGRSGFWQSELDGRLLMIVSDEERDRMRIMTEIVPDDELTDALRQTLLEANFDRALEARFAVSRGFVWALFVHPLAALTADLFQSGLKQVRQLADNYGTTFASTELTFKGDALPEPPGSE